jgi:hypothetical protein
LPARLLCSCSCIPSWTPEQIKSALMTTATENVWTNTAKTILAGVLDRRRPHRPDEGREPGITLDHRASAR